MESSEWVEMTDDDVTKLESVLELYEKTFPIDVREPDNIFLKGLKYAKSSFPNNFHLLVGMKAGQVVSFATGHYLADVNSGFIVYIATNLLARRKGLGSKTMQKIEELLIEDAKIAGHSTLSALILEAEKEDCTLRQYFFEKNKFKLYESIDYLQPPLHGSGKGIPLNLFIKNDWVDELTKEEVSKIIRAMYCEKYYLVNGIDIHILEQCLQEMGIGSLVEYTAKAIPHTRKFT